MEEEIRNDQELYSYYRDRTTTLTKDNFMYLMSHPEVKRLLNDYLSNILLHKPDDVFKFTKDYFKFLSDKGESDKFVVLVGPNSVGKTTLINKICEDFPENFETPKHIVTNNKENCINVSKEEFMDGINNKTIIVYSYDNKENEYEGISKEEIERINNSGKIAILEIDLKGAKTINNSSVDANFIGVLPPSMDALRVRIKQNTKLNTASINNVLEFAETEVKEIENLTFFGFRIMNDELETGYKDMKNAIISLYPFLKYKPEDIEAIKNGNFGREEE
jgi:guanylate kinase